jgi:hypothetical protein
MLASVLLNNEAALAWTEEEKGEFDSRYIPPYQIPLVPHIPWQDRSIRIPAKTREGVIGFLKGKIRTGLYERSQSSYRSAFFAVEKKDGKIRIVHDLQKLNEVTVRDAALPPNMDEMTEDLCCRSIYTGLDVFAGYDQIGLDVESRDPTSFESPLGLLRLCKLSQGLTNAVGVFQKTMRYVYAEEVPEKAQVYVDDLTVKGPATLYKGPDGLRKSIPGNPNIRRFVYDHAQDLNVILHKMKRFGGTFSGKKIELGVREVKIVGYVCSLDGRRVAGSAIAKLEKWVVCKNPHEVRMLLGLLGVARIWVKGFGAMVRPLVNLTKGSVADFEWTKDCDEAVQKAKEAVKSCGVLKPLDYSVIDRRPPILAVDASTDGCGIEIAQIDEKGRRRTARFMSVYYTDVQRRYTA